MSYTPAPWTVGGKYKSDVYGRNGLTTVARSLMSNIGEHEQKANARLIAAAPENYESNKELAAIVRELCAAYKHPLPEASLGRSDAAIAKAEGEV